MEDFLENQHQTSRNDFKELEDFNDKYGKSVSKITNLPRMKHKYEIKVDEELEL